MRFIESIRSYFHPQGKFIIYGRNFPHFSNLLIKYIYWYIWSSQCSIF